MSFALLFEEIKYFKTVCQLRLINLHHNFICCKIEFVLSMFYCRLKLIRFVILDPIQSNLNQYQTVLIFPWNVKSFEWYYQWSNYAKQTITFINFVFSIHSMHIFYIEMLIVLLFMFIFGMNTLAWIVQNSINILS